MAMTNQPTNRKAMNLHLNRVRMNQQLNLTSVRAATVVQKHCQPGQPQCRANRNGFGHCSDTIHKSWVPYCAHNGHVSAGHVPDAASHPTKKCSCFYSSARSATPLRMSDWACEMQKNCWTGSKYRRTLISLKNGSPLVLRWRVHGATAPPHTRDTKEWAAGYPRNLPEQ